MDSISLAWWKRPNLAFTLDYGQQAAATEVAISAQICAQLQVEHHIISIDCSPLGSGDMAGKNADALAPASDWWPYRNQLLITLASMKAVALGVNVLYIGTVRSDEGHLDGTAAFVKRMDALLSYQEGFMRLEAPAIGLSTAELVRHAMVPMGVLAWAHSCHRGGVACGQCRGCNKYTETLHELASFVDSTG